jgi:hypothetical protein
MLRWGMSKSSIGISAVPGKNGDAIDDEIAGSYEPTTNGSQDTEHEKRFVQRCATLSPTLALLRRARNAGLTIFSQR